MDRRKFLSTAAAAAARSLISHPAFALAQEPEAKPDFSIRIEPLALELAPGVVVQTIAYNGIVPGPLIRLQSDKQVRILVENRTGSPELTHWHGLDIDATNDGAMEEGSPVIAPGARQLYSFTPHLTGSRWYHTHMMAGKDLTRATYTGQFGFLYVEPRQDAGAYDQEVFLAIHHWQPELMPMGPPVNSMEVGYKLASFNGRLHGASEPLRVRKGQRVLFHFLNASATQDVALALPGHQFRVTALDGNVVPNPQPVNTLFLGVAERIDAVVEMNAPGVWVLGSTNDRERGNGLGLTVEYADSKGEAAWKDPGKSDWNYTLFGAHPRAVFPTKRFPMVFEKQAGVDSGMDRWTINGASYPKIAPLQVQQGKRYRMGFVNTTGESHPVHLHRHSFELVNVGGTPTSGIFKDTVSVAPYSKVDVDFVANNPGPTLFHCHQQLHMDYGFMQLMEYV